MRNKESKKKIVTIAAIYGVVLPALLFALSSLRAAAIAVPFDTSAVPQAKSGVVSVGDGSSYVSVGDSSSGGFLSLGTSVSHASLGIDAYQTGPSPFWYSVNGGSHIPFPLWGFDGNSASAYTSGAVSIGTSTSVGSSSLAIYPSLNAGEASSAVPLSFYTGTAFNDAAIMVNASVANIPASDETTWNWTDVNKNKAVMGILFGDLNRTGIVMTMAKPYTMDPTAQQYSLNSRWQSVLQLGTDGSAVLGGAPVAAQYVFAFPTYTNSSCSVSLTQDNPDFFVPSFLNWTPGTVPLYVFPTTKVYQPGQTQCFTIGNSVYTYTYTKYQPPAQSNVYVNSVDMVNPSDNGTWSNLSDKDWKTLVSGLEAGNTYKYGDGSIRTPDFKSLDTAVTGPDSDGQTRYLVPNAGDNEQYSTIININPQNSYTLGKYYFNMWVLCPNGYFVNAFKFDTKDGASQNNGSLQPALKCGRL